MQLGVYTELSSFSPGGAVCRLPRASAGPSQVTQPHLCMGKVNHLPECLQSTEPTPRHKSPLGCELCGVGWGALLRLAAGACEAAWELALGGHLSHPGGLKNSPQSTDGGSSGFGPWLGPLAWQPGWTDHYWLSKGGRCLGKAGGAQSAALYPSPTTPQSPPSAPHISPAEPLQRALELVPGFRWPW